MQEDSYRFRVKPNDRVQMPNGKTGTVIDFEIICAGHVMQLRVRPDKPSSGWRRFLPVFTRRYVDDEIDRLELLAAQA